jgi:hypothetical protein
MLKWILRWLFRVLIALVLLALLSLIGLLVLKLFSTNDPTAIGTLVTGIVTAFGVAGAIGTVLYARKQLLIAQKTAYGDFLLRLDEAFVRHKVVHVKLRFGDKYPKVVRPFEFPKDWPAIESYMGLFERIQVLVEEKIIDIDVVDRLYGYRLFNIVANPVIYREKLVKIADGWRDFIKLWLALQKQRDETSSTEETRHRQVNEALITALQSENPTMDRRMAEQQVARYLSRQDDGRDDSTVNALIALLTHSNSDARAFASRELALVRDQHLRARASKALITAVQDENFEVRLWADRTLQFYQQPLLDDA